MQYSYRTLLIKAVCDRRIMQITTEGSQTLRERILCKMKL
jgi:hypothetical protein